MCSFFFTWRNGGNTVHTMPPPHIVVSPLSLPEYTYHPSTQLSPLISFLPISHSSSMDDCYTFREELAITHPLHGHALWEPDPGGLYDAVEVGDVGFIREGCFYSLFNALCPPTNPDLDGPKYPPRLRPKKSPHIRSSRDNQRYFCSKNVTKVSGGTSPFTLG